MNSDTFIRELELDCSGTILEFHQRKIGDVNCVVWDASIVLSKYLDFSSKETKWLNGKKVLELGAGLGCPGITAACLGAHAILTDLEKTMPLLQNNIEANRKHWENAGGFAEAQTLEWDKEVDLNFQPEIILLADCIYYENSVKPLLDVLDIILHSNEGAYAILSQEERDTPKQIEFWKYFTTELNHRFKVEYIPRVEQHPRYSSSDIHLMRIYKKSDA